MAEKKTNETSTFTSTGASPNDSTSLPLSTTAPLAGESSDPAVHQLLAERQALQMNRDTIAPPVDKDALKVVDEQIAEVDKQLSDLGYAQ